jgi:AcrR family transcriptional regulator
MPSTLCTGSSTRRGPVPQRDAARRAQLLDAGLEAFGTQGYATSSIESICAAAHVGTRSFYRYFAGKEDLLEAVYDRQIRSVTAGLTAALGRHPDDVAARVRAGGEAFVAASTGDERAARVQLTGVVGVSERLEARRRGVHRSFAALVEHEYGRLAARGVIRGPVPPLVCAALVGGSNELLVEWLFADPRPSRPELVDALVSLYLKAAA